MQFIIGSNTYNTGKLSAFTQLHISRRLAPCFGKLAALMGAGVTPTRDSAGEITGVDGDMDTIISPLMQAIHDMPDADVEFIINACLAVTERKQPGGGFAPVFAQGVPMYPLPLPEMLGITYQVIKENMTDFFTALPSGFNLEGAVRAAAGPAFQGGKTGSSGPS